jgi:hypothetical protein
LFFIDGQGAATRRGRQRKITLFAAGNEADVREKRQDGDFSPMN